MPKSAAGSVRLAVVASHPIQYFCPQYASWSRLAGIDLRVFFASRHGLEPYRDAGFGATVRWHGLALDFPHEFLAGAAERPVNAAIDAPNLGQRLAGFGPHCLLVYGYGQRLARRAAAWAGRAAVPLLMFTDSELRSRRRWWRRAVKALVLPRRLGQVDRFLTVGDANEAYLRRYGVPDERFIRCPYPVDIEFIEEAASNRQPLRAALRSRLGIPLDRHVVLMAGKLLPHKRQRDLVAFANRVRAVRNDVTVVLAGSGADEAQLRRLAQAHGAGGVVFAGFVQPRTLAHYYCAADVYTHCSEREPYGVAVSEAVCAGLPVVVSDRCGCVGPTADAQPGVNGYAYPCGDVAALTTALARILDSRERREAMGRESLRIGRANQRLAHGAGLLQALDSLGFPP